MEYFQTFGRYRWWTTASTESYERWGHLCWNRCDEREREQTALFHRRAELHLFYSSSSGLKLSQCHQAQHQGLPTTVLATTLCSSISSRHKMVPGILLYQIYHLESTQAWESLSYTPLNMKEEVCKRCRFYVFSSCSPIKTTSGTCIYLLMYLLQQTTIETGHFLIGEGRKAEYAYFLHKKN